jgi:uncharacterized protein (TIGR03437 family)
MRRPYLTLLLVSSIASFAVAAINGVQTRYLDFDQGQSQLLAADHAGNLFVVGTVVEPSGLPQIRVVKTDPSGNHLASFDFGGSNAGSIADIVAAAATDPQGNLVIVGSTPSPNFPAVAPLSSTARLPAAFVVKLDANLQGIQFSTLLGGTMGQFSRAGAVAVDASGNIYVAGTTNETDFPVTANAFQSHIPSDPLGLSGSGFLTEISGSKIVFSTFYGGTTQACNGIGCVIGQSYGITTIVAMALDPLGNIVLAGNTTSADLPTTAGAYLQQCSQCPPGFAGFIAKFAPGGSKLVWATLLPASFAGPVEGIAAMSLAPDGSVVVGGTTVSNILTTPGSLQPTPPNPADSSLNSYGFVSRFDSTGSKLLFSTYLGGYIQSADGVRGIAVDAQGIIWITGGSPPSALPLPATTPALGTSYTVGLSADGSALTSAFTAPAGAGGQAIALTSQDTLVTLGASGSLLLGTSLQPPSLVGLTNSAGGSASGTVAPLDLVTFYGAGLGPSPALGAQVVTQAFFSFVSTSLGGVQVLFDGVPAPLLYAGPTQINAIVPLEVSSQTTIQIVTPNGTIAGPTLRVRPTQPQVFGAPLPGQPYSIAAVALNQDGSVNSPQHQALPGSIVTVWATGAGRFSRSFADGTILTAGTDPNSFVLATIPLPVSVVSSSTAPFGPSFDSVQVLYAGAAPNAVEGVIQVNFRLSGGVFYQLQIGSGLSDPFYIYQNCCQN